MLNLLLQRIFNHTILNFIHFKGYRQHSCFRPLYKTNYLIEGLAISHGCLWQEYQLRKETLPIVLPSMIEAEKFSESHIHTWCDNLIPGMSPVKAKFGYMCTNGCCRLRNTLLVKLCTSWDDGATYGNSLKNRFLEYFAVKFSRFVGYQKGQQTFVHSGHFLISERAKNRRGLNQVNKVDGFFRNGVLSEELVKS